MKHVELIQMQRITCHGELLVDFKLLVHLSSQKPMYLLCNIVKEKEETSSKSPRVNLDFKISITPVCSNE